MKFRKDEKAMVQIKRDWFDAALENYEREDTSLTGKIIRFL